MKKVKNPKDIIRTKNRNVFADAFAKSESGALLVLETKDIGPRVHHIKELAHSTIMEMTRTTPYYRKRFCMVMEHRAKTGKISVQNPYELFKAAKSSLKVIALSGGRDYNAALMTLQFTWSSQKTLTQTVELILG